MTSQLPGPPHSSAAGGGLVASHQNAGRPALERAHTFPTPPTSAHSIMGVGGADGGYPWNGQSLAGHGNQPLSVDIGLSNTRSMPSTPATTPPGTGLHPAQQYANSQGFDGSRPTYSAPPASQNHYGNQGLNRYGQPLQPNSYVKHEMRPPATRGPGSGADTDRGVDGRPADGINHGAGEEELEEEAEHEHEAEYGHDSNAAAAAAYNANRASYGYGAGSAVGSLSSEHARLSPEMNGSPNAHNASGRATPRNTQAAQSQWTTTGYSTPPRSQAPSSSLYNVMGHDGMGKTANGVTAGEAYPSQLSLGGTIQTGYGSQSHPIMNGATSTKRMRDMDEDGGRGSRPSSRGTTVPNNNDGSGQEVDGMKRRKTLREDSLPMIGAAAAAAAAAAGMGTNGLDLDGNRGLNRTRSTIVQRRR